jgi:hypothetical protein
MPMDVDAVVAQQKISELSKLVTDQPHMERGEICDDIIEFVKQMQEKYGKENNRNSRN